MHNNLNQIRPRQTQNGRLFKVKKLRANKVNFSFYNFVEKNVQ